jgi:type I restriction enzyme S subunit
MNATLEGMAQALFKSWFVDFDPVIDNALAAGNPIPDEFAPRAEVRKNALVNGTTQQGSVDHATLSDPKSLFPAAFHFDHELGWIPEGWEVTSVEHERTLRPGLAYKAKHKAEIGTPMVTLGSVSFTERFLPKGLVNYTGEFKPQHLVSPGDLVIASHDITQERKQLGSPAMIPRWVSSEEIIVATNLFKLSNDRESYLSDHFLYWTLRADKFREEMIKSARGTAILFINRASAGKYLFARPPRDLSQQFDGVAESLYDAHQNNEVSSRSLIAIRDTLLPKLISGDLRSGDAESVTDKETKEISA